MSRMQGLSENGLVLNFVPPYHKTDRQGLDFYGMPNGSSFITV